MTQLTPRRLAVCFRCARPGSMGPMDAPQNTASPSSVSSASRRTEDIALDLLKFVAAHANVGAKPSGSTGFAAPSTARSEDQVANLLELYGRCREAVEAPLDK